MFGSIFRQAQETVDNAIGHFVTWSIVILPFVIAVGFGTSALFIWLSRRFDVETVDLILAGGFAAVGLVAAIVAQARNSKPATPIATPEAAPLSSPPNGSPDDMSGIDRELIMAALSAAAPVALPGLMRTLTRNIPLLLAVAGSVFVMTRSTESPMSAPQAAE